MFAEIIDSVPLYILIPSLIFMGVLGEIITNILIKKETEELNE